MLNNIPYITLLSPGAVAFNIFNWPVRWYGIFIAIGFLLAYLLAEKLIQKSKLDLNCFNDLIFLILVFGIIFARLYFVALSWDYFKIHLDEIPKIWLGGQSIHGGILGAIIAALIYSFIKKISFYRYMDVIAVIMPLGQAIGRWGNFFNNEAFGKPVDNWFIRLFIPSDFRPVTYTDYNYFHPTFLYESFFDFVIFVFLYRKYSKWVNKPGKLFWTYLLLYSTVRFFLEFVRIDSLCMFGGIPGAQVVSFLVIVLSLIFVKES